MSGDCLLAAGELTGDKSSPVNNTLKPRIPARASIMDKTRNRALFLSKEMKHLGLLLTISIKSSIFADNSKRRQ